MVTKATLDSLRKLHVRITALGQKAESIKVMAHRVTSDLNENNDALKKALDAVENAATRASDEVDYEAVLKEANDAYGLAGLAQIELSELSSEVRATINALSAEGKSEAELALMLAEEERDANIDQKEVNFQVLQDEITVWEKADTEQNRHARDTALEGYRRASLVLAASEERLVKARKRVLAEKEEQKAAAMPPAGSTGPSDMPSIVGNCGNRNL